MFSMTVACLTLYSSTAAMTAGFNSIAILKTKLFYAIEVQSKGGC